MCVVNCLQLFLLQKFLPAHTIQGDIYRKIMWICAMYFNKEKPKIASWLHFLCCSGDVQFNPQKIIMLQDETEQREVSMLNV